MRARLTGEVLGTYLMVLIGTGSVATAVLTGALQGLWQVAVVWGIGVAVAIYCSAALSGAHLNPAVSLALALARPGEFSPRLLPAYWCAQFVGAIAAGLTVLAAYGSLLERFEVREGLVRGAPGSERAAMIFGEYFPNPGIVGVGPEAVAWVNPWQAFAIEAFGTALLVLVIFALTDPLSTNAPGPAMAPVIIGATVAVLICLFSPLTQAGWNPARDFGPRLVAWLAGYGEIAIPGPRFGFWVYIAGPLVGGALAGLLYTHLIHPALTTPWRDS